ncbi:MAG: serine hydrolase [Candidatus Komeilibacteria bacterium]
MKLGRFFCLIIITLILVAPFSAMAATASKTAVKKPVLPSVTYIKTVNGKVTASSQADKQLPPASMTKLMTALVVLDAKPDWSKKVTIIQDYLDYPKLFVGNDVTSEVGLRVGDTMTVYDLWVAMLVASSNQSARALVDAVGLPYNTFLQKMNAKAKALGLKKTVFKDVAGLNENTLTTAKEMAVIAKEAFSQSAIVRASSVGAYTIVTTQADGNWREIPVVDRNYSLQQFTPDACKTGYLVEAQRTVSLKKGNIIVVIMHAISMAQRNSILQKLLFNS